MEVKKLDPNSRPPVLEPNQVSSDELQLTYRSERGLSPLAEGLILGAGDLFNTPLTVDVIRHSDDPHEAVLSVKVIQ